MKAKHLIISCVIKCFQWWIAIVSTSVTWYKYSKVIYFIRPEVIPDRYQQKCEHQISLRWPDNDLTQYETIFLIQTDSLSNILNKERIIKKNWKMIELYFSGPNTKTDNRPEKKLMNQGISVHCIILVCQHVPIKTGIYFFYIYIYIYIHTYTHTHTLWMFT